MPHEPRRPTCDPGAIGVSETTAGEQPSDGLLRFYRFDQDYVRKLGEGDPAVEEHFTSYFTRLLHLKLRGRVRSRDALEEARQETFVRVLQVVREKGSLEHPERLGAFVNSVCDNVLFEKFRHDARNAQLQEEFDWPDRRINLDAPLISQERRRLVESVLAELSRRDQELLRMVFLEEAGKAEACARLGVGEGYLRVLIHRAKVHLREKLATQTGPAAERLAAWFGLKRSRGVVHHTVRYSDGT